MFAAVVALAAVVSALWFVMFRTTDSPTRRPSETSSTDATTATPEATATPPQSGLSWAALRNATYPSELPRGKRAPLQDGIYEEEIAPGSATRLRIQLADIAGFGDIDSDASADAAAVLVGSPGGSGTFIYLVAVLNDGGSANPVASTLLGDRIAVRAIRIEDHKIIVGMRVRGPSDPFAVLTREVTRVYSLQNGQIVLENEQTADVPSAPPGQFTYQTQRLTVEVGKVTTRQGTLRPGELVTYLVHADAGQELRVTVMSQFNNAILSIQGVGDNAQLVSRSSYSSTWSGRLPGTQDYSITIVTLAGNDLKYEVSLELRPAPTPAQTPTAAAPVSGKEDEPPQSVAPLPAPLTGVFHPEQVELSALSPEAVLFLEGRQESFGVAVVSPAASTVWAQNGDAQLELASSVKVLIALAVLDAAQREDRYVDTFELALLWPMITISDNDSATKLWDEIGGGRGLANYLTVIGATGIRPYNGPYWGTSTASANAMAAVLARAVFGDLLNEAHRALLVKLMESVSPSQWWGVTAGYRTGNGDAGVVGVKNGWYPDDAGWRVNSFGFIASSDAQRYYTIAVLTNGQASLRSGIDTIEGVSARVSAAFG